MEIFADNRLNDSSVLSFRYRAWVFIQNEETKIADVYAYTVVDAKRRAAQRALETLMKKQPSHVSGSEEESTFVVIGEFLDHQ